MTGIPRSRAFTLIELMVATSLIALLVASATTAFFQLRNLVHRIQARQQMHNTARVVYERMALEISSLMQGAAIFATGRKADTSTSPATPGPMEFIFLRGKQDSWDFATGFNPPICLTDQVWTRWYWDPVRRCIFNSSSSPSTSENGPRFFLPNPERVVKSPTATPPASPPPLAEQKMRATLGDPLYASPTLWSSTDSDYDDLVARQGAIATDCTAFHLVILCQDGSVQTIDSTGASDTAYLADGQPVDGRAGTAAPATAPALPKRPRLVRLRFTLTEPGRSPTDPEAVQETFCFSFQAPALSPP